MTEAVRFENRVKIIACGNDLHKPDALHGEDREAFMDISRDTWEWVPHRILKERWNDLHPEDKVFIDEDDYDEDGWYVEWHGKRKVDFGEWFRRRNVSRQIEEIENEREASVINNARRLAQLKRKHAGLKIAFWFHRKHRPVEEQVVDGSSDAAPEEPVSLTTEEERMVEMLRGINKNRSEVLRESHKRAAAMLKRKRDHMAEDALFESNKRVHDRSCER